MRSIGDPYAGARAMSAITREGSLPMLVAIPRTCAVPILPFVIALSGRRMVPLLTVAPCDWIAAAEW
ncbi:hypothetical protein BLA9940_02080 [Burkholderia aenigmatica]|nr:hypothetical protein BLA9940_02080 [Burkholderia aenigmatica]